MYLYLSSVWLDVDQEHAPKRQTLKSDWNTCLKHVNHLKLNRPLNYDHMFIHIYWGEGETSINEFCNK